MNTQDSDRIRTVAFTGQNGAGKTSLIETLLHRTGMINVAGSIEKGTTV